jgi:hypothetical protein
MYAICIQTCNLCINEITANYVRQPICHSDLLVAVEKIVAGPNAHSQKKIVSVYDEHCFPRHEGFQTTFISLGGLLAEVAWAPEHFMFI